VLLIHFQCERLENGDLGVERGDHANECGCVCGVENGREAVDFAGSEEVGVEDIGGKEGWAGNCSCFFGCER
jgi:hypothetical protein